MTLLPAYIWGMQNSLLCVHSCLCSRIYRHAVIEGMHLPHAPACHAAAQARWCISEQLAWLCSHLQAGPSQPDSTATHACSFLCLPAIDRDCLDCLPLRSMMSVCCPAGYRAGESQCKTGHRSESRHRVILLRVFRLQVTQTGTWRMRHLDHFTVAAIYGPIVKVLTCACLLH